MSAEDKIQKTGYAKVMVSCLKLGIVKTGAKI